MEIITSGRHAFNVVDAVPYGYEIWNIGKNMVDGYLPLCRLSSVQPFSGGRAIEADSLKAIKTDGAQIILDAVGYGPKTVKEMELYIAKYKKSRNKCKRDVVTRMERALPYMHNIKGL